MLTILLFHVEHMKKELLIRIRSAAKKLAFAKPQYTERQIYQTLKRQVKAGDIGAMTSVLENT